MLFLPSQVSVRAKVVALALLMAVVLFVVFLALPVTGRVRDSRDLDTIADARVSVECRKTNMIHGSSVLKTLEARTDTAGVFRFGRVDLAPCDFMFVTAAKSGYVMTSSIDTRYDYTDYESIPAEVFLTPVGAIRLQYFEYEYANTKGEITKYSGEPDPAGAYHRVFTGFHCSKRIAQSADEIKYVREAYCERLRKLEAGLSNPQRDQLPSRTRQLCARGGPAGRIDLMEVHEFCGYRSEGQVRSNTALLTDAYHSALRAARGAAKRER